MEIQLTFNLDEQNINKERKDTHYFNEQER